MWDGLARSTADWGGGHCGGGLGVVCGEERRRKKKTPWKKSMCDIVWILRGTGGNLYKHVHGGFSPDAL